MRTRRTTAAATVDGVVVSTSQIRTLAGSTGDLDLAASDLAESVERVGESTVESTVAAEAAAAATARVEHGAGAVAGAASQMSAAMHEVASSAAAATAVTAEAAVVTTEVRDAVERLGSSTTQIGGVVRTVAGISDQTRMLALNATIEAARAGSAGRGFAVVAEEVKNLAALTHEATAQIGDQLAVLAADSDNMRRAAERIDDVLRRIDGLQQTIAAAVEEQTAAIAEITRSAADVAGAATDLDSSVSASVAAARRASEAVGRARTWLEAVGHALDEQRAEMTALAGGVELHPLRAAITSHAGWKRALREAIETGRHPGGVDPGKAARSDACAFGQWLARGEG
ncbi:MAG TPA: methyl-accepting chemotaxis protein, partial [Actinotalea sp.]|nr:methyl-accepting chemotaxis protein [Actinotalea sp.]